MGQLGFFDAERRLAALLEKGDPLETIGGLVPWESFRADIEAVVLTPEEAKKSKAGRKPLDALVVFRMLVLQALYNLSDEQIEYQVRDRLSFTRFLGLGFEDGIPDGTTLWLFREKLAQAGLIDKLFDQFDRQLNAKGYIARGGQMVDASIVPAPKPRNTREENEVLKRGETPPAWEEKPAKNRQKDKDARWTKKHGKSFFGYKNHVNVDRTHKLIRRYAATDAAEHDSRQLDGLLRRGNTSRDVFGDSAYRSAAAEARLTAQGFRSRIHVRATRGHPLSKAKAAANRAKSRIRARIEHVFGSQFIEPTVFVDVTPEMRIAREEIFGPVLAVLKWRDKKTMLAEVNAVPYGLTCAIWTNDLNAAHRTALAVDAGFVWINDVSGHFLGAPFGGVKQSGIGREECLEELLGYTREKNIHVKLRH